MEQSKGTLLASLTEEERRVLVEGPGSRVGPRESGLEEYPGRSSKHRAQICVQDPLAQGCVLGGAFQVFIASGIVFSNLTELHFVRLSCVSDIPCLL